jgi:hypothetical protein
LDLEALGLNKTTVDKNVRNKVSKQEMVSFSTMVGRSSSNTIRLAGVSAASMEAQSHLLELVDEDFAQVKVNSEMSQNMLAQLMDQMCDTQIPTEEVY